MFVSVTKMCSYLRVAGVSEDRGVRATNDGATAYKSEAFKSLFTVLKSFGRENEYIFESLRVLRYPIQKGC